MKNRKLLSVFIAVVMLFSSVSVGAFAVQPKSNVIYRASDNVVANMLEKQLKKNSAEVQKKLANASSYKLYDQLTAAEKIIYDGIVKQEAGINTSNGNFKVEITNGYKFNYDEYEIYKSIITAVAAVIDDVPELYWLLPVPYDFEYVLLSNGNLELTFIYNSDYSHISSIATLKQEYLNTLNAAKTFPVTGTTRYERVKSIAYGICDITDYAYDITDEDYEYFYPSNCLLEPHEVVCDGYAKAFKMICDANNIPSVIVVGIGIAFDYDGNPVPVGHAWNYVQMEDGRWYAVDTTWMDDNPFAEDYFLAGSDTPDVYSDAFSESHIIDGLRFSVKVPNTDYYEPITMSYPALSTSAYDPDNVKSTPDVNSDGKITTVDAKWILQYIANSRDFNDTQSTIADLNGDGKISVVDVKWVLQIVAGTRDADTLELIKK